MIMKLTLNFRISTPKTGNTESRSVKSNTRLYEASWNFKEKER